MSGLFDLLFFALIVWVVLRAAGRAMGGLGGEAGDDAGPSSPGPRAELPRQTERRRPAGAPERRIDPTARHAPGSPEIQLRNRLMEELRRWEEAQRTRQPASLEAQRMRQPAALGVEAPPPAPRPATPSPARAPAEPDTEVGAAAARQPEKRASRLAESRALERARAVAARRRAPSDSAGGALGEREAGREGRAVPSASERSSELGSGALPDFSRLSAAQRAVLWAEILGRPTGLRD